MSGIPNSKMLDRMARRRKLSAFLTVGAATFFCLSMIWPLSIKAWRSESDISLTLTKRQDSSTEFKKLLEEVVLRHTSHGAIANSLELHGLEVDGANIPSTEMAKAIQDRLNIVLVNESLNPDEISVRIGLDGEATDKDNYFVNMLATTIARDFMTSPLAGILPTEPLPIEDIESLQRRHTEIEQRANELLAQIQSNMQATANEMVQSDPGTLTLEGIDDGPESGELALADSENKPLFRMASHARGASSESSLTLLFDSLHSTIGDLANVAAEACTAVEAAARTRPAFSVQGVQSKPARPVSAIPNRRELLFLLLASGLFASIVSVAYKPFAQTGFESVEHVGKTLDLPVIATLESENRFDDVTGPGLPAEDLTNETPGSNQIVNICKWILFCSLMLTIGFCLVNADIRNAFFVSPFHGFAEIVWTLKGN